MLRAINSTERNTIQCNNTIHLTSPHLASPHLNRASHRITKQLNDTSYAVGDANHLLTPAPFAITSPPYCQHGAQKRSVPTLLGNPQTDALLKKLGLAHRHSIPAEVTLQDPCEINIDEIEDDDDDDDEDDIHKD